MRILFLTILIDVLLVITGYTGQKYCFVQDKFVWIQNVETRVKEKLFAAKDHDYSISPDGKQIAYCDYENGRRTIVVYSIETKKNEIFKNLPEQSYQPLWSWDGKKLGFNIAGKGAGIINTDGTGFMQLPLKECYFGYWNPEDQSVVYFDFTNFYEIDLQGKNLKTTPLADITGNVGISSATRFQITADGREILFDSMVEEPMPNLHDAVEALFIYNTSDHSRKRITPKGYSVMYPYWEKDHESVLFSGFTNKDVHKNDVVNARIYRCDLKTSEIKAIGTYEEFSISR